MFPIRAIIIVIGTMYRKSERKRYETAPTADTTCEIISVSYVLVFFSIGPDIKYDMKSESTNENVL